MPERRSGVDGGTVDYFSDAVAYTSVKIPAR